MLNPDFWKNLEYRLTFYDQLLEKSKKEDSSFSENQNKSDRQQYEDKLDQFIQLKTFYDNFFFPHSK